MPSPARELVWKPRLQEYAIPATILSQEEIARDDFEWQKYNNFDVILVDESHNFRNSGTKNIKPFRKSLAPANLTRKSF